MLSLVSFQNVLIIHRHTLTNTHSYTHTPSCAVIIERGQPNAIIGLIPECVYSAREHAPHEAVQEERVVVGKEVDRRAVWVGDVCERESV
jgi:hypothetical protein